MPRKHRIKVSLKGLQITRVTDVCFCALISTFDFRDNRPMSEGRRGGREQGRFGGGGGGGNFGGGGRGGGMRSGWVGGPGGGGRKDDGRLESKLCRIMRLDRKIIA